MRLSAICYSVCFMGLTWFKPINQLIFFRSVTMMQWCSIHEKTWMNKNNYFQFHVCSVCAPVFSVCLFALCYGPCCLVQINVLICIYNIKSLSLTVSRPIVCTPMSVNGSTHTSKMTQTSANNTEHSGLAGPGHGARDVTSSARGQTGEGWPNDER